jgi:parallel beta-helix repeat protein
MKKTLRILGTAVILMVLLAFGMPGPAMADDPVPVTINAPAEVDPDTDFTATVDIGEVSELNTAQYDIWFDPAVLRLDSIDFGLINSKTIVAMPIEIKSGHWRVVNYLVIMTDNVSGSGYLSVLNFHIIGDLGESSDIYFSGGILSGISGPISATWTGDTVLIPPPEPPVVDTIAATDITQTSATLHGHLVSLGDYASVSLSFVWGPDSEADPADYPYEVTATPASLDVPGAFSAALDGLDSDTPYYYRAKATGSVTVYGDEESFITEKIPPSVTTGSATGVTTGSAELNMSYDFEDYGSGEVRFAYKPHSESTWANTSWTAKAGSGSYGETVAGLSSNTFYDFKAQLKYDSTEIEGNVEQFTTDKEIPSVVTGTATGITDDSADLNMSYDFSDYGSGEVRFAYKPHSESTWANTSWTAKAGSGSYGETVSGLSSDNIYDFKAQLKYDSTEIEGAVEPFTTAKAPPEVSTGAATDITTSSATVNGTLVSLGDYASFSLSFVWGPDAEADPADYPNETAATPASLATSGNFSAALSGLNSNTPYYYRAKATGSVTIYGEEQTFTTEKIPPAVTTDAATNITTDSADLNMTYDFKDYGSGEVSFAYKPAAEGTWSYTSWVAQSGSSTYARTVTGLSSNTLYDFKALLRYDSTEIEGNVEQFIAGKILPVITTDPATGITTVSAELNMTYDFKDYSSGNVSFAYKKASDVDWIHTDWVAKAGSGTYTEPLSGLTSDTAYEFKAQLKYDSTEIEGKVEPFTTAKVPPEVTTGDATDITTSSATVNGTLVSPGDYASVSLSFVWGPNSEADPADYPNKTAATPASLAASGNFSAALSGLTSDTPYYYRSKATGSITVYGEEQTFTTEKIPPVVTTDTATDITTDSADLNMTYDFKDYGSGEVRFAYKQNTEIDWTYTDWIAKSASGTYAETVNGLTSNTLYNFKAQLKYDSTEIEGAVEPFTTAKVPPEVTTGPATDITTSSATVNGTLVSLGDYASFSLSFVWGPDAKTDPADYPNETAATPASLAASGNFSAALSGLNSDTTYYYRAKVTGETTVYGEEQSFATEKIPPSVTTGTATDITDMTVTLHGNLDRLGDYSSANVSFVGGMESEVDPANYPAESPPVSMTSTGAFSVNVTDLYPNTLYYYRARVETDNITLYGEEKTFTTYSLPPQVWVDDDFSANTTGWGHDYFATIQDAINGVEPLVGVVNVYNGTYTDNVSVNKSITVQSVNGAGSTTVMLGPTSYFEVVEDYVNVIGFNVMGSSLNGIYLDQVYYCNISDCIVSGFGGGIVLVEANNNRLDGNTIRDNIRGIDLINSQYNEVLGNNIFENNQDGIYLFNASWHNVIHFNNIVGNVDYGVYNENISENVSAKHNWWGDATGPGTVGPGTGDNVTKNIDYIPWLRAAVGNVTAGSITDGMLDAIAGADTEVLVTGSANVTVAKYTGNPGVSSLAGNIGKYIDVYIGDVSNVNEIELRLYYTDAEITGKVESSLKLYWWNDSTSSWAPCSDSDVNTAIINGYSGYIWAKIRNDGTTTPTLTDLAATPFGPKANTSGGGPGGGGGGGGPSGTTNLNEFTDNEGKFLSDATAESPDGLVKVYIPKDTVAKSRTGQRLRYVTIKSKSAPSDPPAECEYICLTYDIGPIGVTFDPLAYVIFKYSDDDVPEGVAEENLVLATWQDGAWVDLEGCVVDLEKNTITAPVNHFSVFTAMAHTSPASIGVIGLTVTPSEVQPDTLVTVSVTATNSGDLTGDYTVTLKVNDSSVQDKVVTLKGGESQKVSFTVTQRTAGEYNVAIGALLGKFTVKEPEHEGAVAEVPAPGPPAPSTTERPAEKPVTTVQPEKQPEQPAQAPVEPIVSGGIAWWLILIYVVCGVVVVGVPTYYFVRRRF